jgi:hypothetical protein
MLLAGRLVRKKNIREGFVLRPICIPGKMGVNQQGYFHQK